MGELCLTKGTQWKELDNLDNSTLSLYVIQVTQFIIYGMMTKRKNHSSSTYTLQGTV